MKRHKQNTPYGTRGVENILAGQIIRKVDNAVMKKIESAEKDLWYLIVYNSCFTSSFKEYFL